MGKDKVDKLKKYIKEDRPSRFKSYVRKHDIVVTEVELRKHQSILHVCCKYGSEGIFRYLLKKGVDINRKDDDGNTALHLALKLALKSPSKTVYTSMVLPLIEKDPALLEVVNNSGTSCRYLLDKLVKTRQSSAANDNQYLHDSDESRDSWEDKLADELHGEDGDPFYNGHYDDDGAETYDEWANRLSREYHQKHRYKHPQYHREKASTSQPKEEGKEDLENARRKMRQKYEENMKRDRENRTLIKSRRYLQDLNSLMAGDGVVKFKDIPWPFTESVSEIKTVMFGSSSEKDEDYRKRLREEQIRWHPDKFIQKLDKRLCDIDREKILDRVKEISQELNRLSDLK